MKLRFWLVPALFGCVQAITFLPLGAQLTVEKSFAADVASLQFATSTNDDSFVRLKPDGVNTNPGWALDQIGEGFSPTTATQIYSYPDTSIPVRLYLIDTAVRNPSSFLAANPNLKSLEVISLSELPPVPRDHGTQMLSLVVGAGTGIATGTPIHVVNYDIYSDSPSADPTTDVTTLAEAIAEAVMHSRLPGTVAMRSVICIATSSSSPAQRYAIDRSIDSATAAGIPVILSAGNLGADASSHTPPSNGVKNGVVCVGASDQNNLKIPSSNFGISVDILAPGHEVRSRNGGDPALDSIVPMTGSSPATALVAGAVLVKLSTSPTFTPAGIESSLKAAAQAMPSDNKPVLRSLVAPTSEFAAPDIVPDGPLAGVPSPIPLGSSPFGSGFLRSTGAQAATPTPVAIDLNANGISDIVETFHGMQQNTLPSSSISLDANQQVQFRFPIDQNLLDGAVSGDTFILRNGYSWKIRCSSDFSAWSIPAGSLSKTTDAQGQAWLTATFPAGPQASCFARIEIVVPPPLPPPPAR